MELNRIGLGGGPDKSGYNLFATTSAENMTLSLGLVSKLLIKPHYK